MKKVIVAESKTGKRKSSIGSCKMGRNGTARQSPCRMRIVVHDLYRYITDLSRRFKAAERMGRRDWQKDLPYSKSTPRAKSSMAVSNNVPTNKVHP